MPCIVGGNLRFLSGHVGEGVAYVQGGGLLEAAERAPIVSHIVMALLGLREAAHFAKGNRNNCLQLDALGQDILRVFDFHGA